MANETPTAEGRADKFFRRGGLQWRKIRDEIRAAHAAGVAEGEQRRDREWLAVFGAPEPPDNVNIPLIPAVAQAIADRVKHKAEQRAYERAAEVAENLRNRVCADRIRALARGREGGE